MNDIVQEALSKGVEMHKAGQLDLAKQLYTSILQLQPQHPDANHNLGVIAVDAGNIEEAVPFLQTALEADPNQGQYWISYIETLIKLDALDDARSMLNQAKEKGASGDAFDQLERTLNELTATVADNGPDNSPDEKPTTVAKDVSPPQDKLQALIDLHSNGHFQQVVLEVQKFLKKFPNSAILYNIQGISNAGLKQFDEAIDCYKKALEIKPDYAEVYRNLGVSQKNIGDLDAAIDSYQHAITINPDYFETFYNMGNALRYTGNLEAAVNSYKKAIKIRPDYAEAFYNLGITLKQKDDLEAAIESFRKAAMIRTNYAEAHNNLGIALKEKGDLEASVNSFQKAITIQPEFAEAYNNLGNVLNDKGSIDVAIKSFNLALKIKPDYAEAHNNLGNILKVEGHLEAAVASYEEALKIKPNYYSAYSALVYEKAAICDWQHFDSKYLNEYLCSNDPTKIEFPMDPFPFLHVVSSPEVHLRIAELYAKNTFKQQPLPFHHKPKTRPNRLRVGYFSNDFKQHPTMTHLIRTLELHDSKKFEVFAFSFGQDSNDKMRQRLTKAVDSFIDVKGMSLHDTALLARKKKIDIAIDLNGYTAKARTGIFAYRAAPIQINYFGYPGTMGADFMDYIIADEIIIPKEHEASYSENVISLPGCYMPQDNTRHISDKMVSRSQHGLPQYGFVFCCFNKNHKINVREFKIWARLLSKIPDSVLWLYNSNRWSPVNLKIEATKLGIDPNRIIFADKLSTDEHLARHRLADLFLDTFNYNAHGTAGDALWAGLPIVTKMGDGFAGRVAGSLLSALNIPELIAKSDEGYEAVALSLATDSTKLSAIKRKLAENLTTTPLFDTETYTRNLEKAYNIAYAKYCDGLEPAEFKV